MATILAYTSPALGHFLPISALLTELSNRGHEIHVRTLSAGVQIGRTLGFVTECIDPRIEAIHHEDWKAPNPRAALKMALEVFARRGVYEVDDLRAAIEQIRPAAVIVDVTVSAPCRPPMPVLLPGCASRHTFLHSMRAECRHSDPVCTVAWHTRRVRDAAVRPFVTGALEAALLPAVNIRADVGLAPVSTADQFLRRAPLLLVATGKPFEYPQGEWGSAVHMIGPCVFEPGADAIPPWLDAIDQPIILVTTSSEHSRRHLGDDGVDGIADEPVHLVATFPAGMPEGLHRCPTRHRSSSCHTARYSTGRCAR